jgi:hypothetical protein
MSKHDDKHQPDPALAAWKPVGLAATKQLWSTWTDNQRSAYVHSNPDGFTSGWLNANQLNCYGAADNTACSNIGVSPTPQPSQEDYDKVSADVQAMHVQTGKPVPAKHGKK